MLRTDLSAVCVECHDPIEVGTPCDVCDCCGRNVLCIDCSDYMDYDDDGSVLVMIVPSDSLSFRRATSRMPREREPLSDYRRRPYSVRP